LVIRVEAAELDTSIMQRKNLVLYQIYSNTITSDLEGYDTSILGDR